MLGTGKVEEELEMEVHIKPRPAWLDGQISEACFADAASAQSRHSYKSYIRTNTLITTIYLSSDV